MKGTIVGINSNVGNYAFKDEFDSYGYFNLMDSIELNIGEQIEGELHPCAGETLIKTDTGEHFEVYIQDFNMSYSAVKQAFTN